MNKLLTGVVVAFFAATSAVVFLPTKQAEAASGWTYLDHNQAHWARACKDFQTGDYGNVYHVTYQFYRKTTAIASIDLTITRNGNLVNHEANNSWLYGSIAGVSDYASAHFPDKVTFGATSTSGVYSNAGAGNQSVSGLANCAW